MRRWATFDRGANSGCLPGHLHSHFTVALKGNDRIALSTALNLSDAGGYSIKFK